MKEREIPITSETVIDNRASRKLGTSFMHLPEGRALCTDAISLTVIIAEDDVEKFIMVIAVANFEGQHLGSLSPLSPNEARNLAASIIESANQIDGGAVQ